MKEFLLFSPQGKWEIAHKEGNYWIARGEWTICAIGEEIELRPMPAKPRPTREEKLAPHAASDVAR